jgi:nicotinate-nucleotide--dimethylbenzimidazole phosphoribosyltransferase
LHAPSSIDVTVVDCGVAETLQPHERLLMRKIAHGTRNTRANSAMSMDQAHAGMRAGMEIGDKLQAAMSPCWLGVGVGAHESAALVLSRLTDSPVRDLVVTGPDMSAEHLAHLMVVLQGAQGGTARSSSLSRCWRPLGATKSR